MIDDCRFCALASSPDVIVLGSVFVVPDKFPVTPGHSLVVPIRHSEDFFGLNPEELEDTRKALVWLRERLLQHGADGFNIGWNCGSSAGQTIAHAHCHLIPRRAGDVVDPTGGVRGVIPAMQNYRPREAVGAMAS